MNVVNRSKIIINSLWGIIANLFQTLFLSLFFIVLSRQYSILEFSNFLIANTVYQLVLGFSSMGLGHWFVREYQKDDNNKLDLVYKFIKIQTILGLIFYFLNFIIVLCIYDEEKIINLAIVLGTNIVFDNILYALKNLNTAQQLQKSSAIILAADSLLRLIISCILFIYPISLMNLSILLVLIRWITINAFIQIGIKENINLKKLWRFKITLIDFKENVIMNWKFILIVGSSIIFWRSATIIISKYLTVTDVANYEISYKIFSIFTMISIIVSTSIFPTFIKLFNKNLYDDAKSLYKVVSYIYTIFAIISYAFIQSYATDIIPYLFGKKYISAGECLQEMFLTILIFPSAFLQANLLVALNLEKKDMLLNLVSLFINIFCCLIGLQFFKSVSVINYSIFTSFLIFHVIQGLYLKDLKLTTIENLINFYVGMIVFVFVYKYVVSIYNPTMVFACFICFIIVPYTYFIFEKTKGFVNSKMKIIPKSVQ